MKLSSSSSIKFGQSYKFITPSQFKMEIIKEKVIEKVIEIPIIDNPIIEPIIEKVIEPIIEPIIEKVIEIIEENIPVEPLNANNIVEEQVR
jgi:hypothetical protein